MFWPPRVVVFEDEFDSNPDRVPETVNTNFLWGESLKIQKKPQTEDRQCID
jgi:hypothetical protein